MSVECPACGSESFRIERVDQYDDGPSFTVLCSRCGNHTAQVLARSLDARLQKDDEQSGLTDY